MANQPCPTALICDCAPTPFRNFSSEAPDPADFFAFAYFFNDPPLNAPPVDFTNPIGIGGCYSVVSQNDANDCALRVAQNDAWDPWRQPQGGHVQEFGNTEQTCHFPCPNGAPDFVFTIAAGTVIAHSQAEADELAASLCRYRGQLVIDCAAPIVPPSIEVVDLMTLWDLAPNSGNLVGETPFPGDSAGWFNNGGITLPAGAVQGSARAVNDFGDIGGQFSSGANNNGFWYDGIIRDLGFLVSGNVIMFGMASDGFSVKQDGSGGAGTNSSLYNPLTSTFTNLGFLGGGDITVPGIQGAPSADMAITQRKVINSSHQIVGTSRIGTDRHAFRWSGAFTDITPLTALPNPQAGSISIDDTGAVMGTFLSVPMFSVQRCFLNLSGGAANSNDIGGVGILAVVAQSMSAKNQIICGICNDGSGFINRPFRWNSVEGFKLIDRIAGAASFPTMDCNSHGDIVGSDANPFGWIWRGGTVYKLIDILNAWATDPLWTAITTAELTNDDRQIAGFGIHSGVPKAYLLTLPAGTETGPPPP